MAKIMKLWVTTLLKDMAEKKRLWIWICSEPLKERKGGEKERRRDGSERKRNIKEKKVKTKLKENKRDEVKTKNMKRHTEANANNKSHCWCTNVWTPTHSSPLLLCVCVCCINHADISVGESCRGRVPESFSETRASERDRETGRGNTSEGKRREEMITSTWDNRFSFHHSMTFRDI